MLQILWILWILWRLETKSRVIGSKDWSEDHQLYDLQNDRLRPHPAQQRAEAQMNYWGTLWTWGMWIGLEVLPVGHLGSMGHCAGCDVVFYLIGKLVCMVMSVIMICGEESHEPGLSGSTHSYWKSSGAAPSKSSMYKREEPWLNLLIELSGRVKSRSDLSGDDDDLTNLAIHASGGFCCIPDWTKKGWTVP